MSPSTTRHSPMLTSDLCLGGTIYSFQLSDSYIHRYPEEELLLWWSLSYNGKYRWEWKPVTKGSCEVGYRKLRSKGGYLRGTHTPYTCTPSPFTHRALLGTNLGLQGFSAGSQLFPYDVLLQRLQDENPGTVKALFCYGENTDSWQRGNCYSSNSKTLKLQAQGRAHIYSTLGCPYFKSNAGFTRIYRLQSKCTLGLSLLWITYFPLYLQV